MLSSPVHASDVFENIDEMSTVGNSNNFEYAVYCCNNTKFFLVLSIIDIDLPFRSFGINEVIVTLLNRKNAFVYGELIMSSLKKTKRLICLSLYLSCFLSIQ